MKSHSSSIVEAQADRVRRKAEREGLLKEPVEDEPVDDAKASAKAPKKKTVSTKKPAPASPKASDEPAPKVADKAKDSSTTPPQKEEPTQAPSSGPASKVVSSGSTPGPAPIPPPPPAIRSAGQAAKPAPAAQAPAAAKPAVSSKPAAKAPAAAAKPEASAQPATAKAASATADTVEPTPEKAVATPNPAESTSSEKTPAAKSEPAKAEKSPASSDAEPETKKAPAPEAKKPAPKGSGPKGEPRKRGQKPGSSKPIPPPPGPPRGRGGKPIPPPPGGGQKKKAEPAGSGRGGSNFRGGPNRGSAPSRPGGGPGGPSGGPGRGPGPGGGGPVNRGRGGPNRGGPGRGGPGNRGRGRRKSRRRSRDELTPMDVPTYSSEDAPVPTGVVIVERASTAQDLGPKLNRTAADVVRCLLTNGEMVTATQSLTDEMIEMFATEIGVEIKLINPGEEQEVELRKLLEVDEVEDDSELPLRPPVITVMGHVDHGKTLLLDRIRSANVVAGEAGGITQHIGAYQISRDDKLITFLDTPGHEAFTAMRARGADATDIVVLVVAADDGVMPQTLEALDHAKAAEVPIIVAVNKMDREGADPDRVMTQLAERDLIPEAWGGDTIMVKTSAMTGDGIDDLIDNLLLIAEVEDLRATAEDRATGSVLESHLDIGRGPVATVLVERGTLRVGDPLVTGASWGRVRALLDDRGESVDEAGPSTPVQVLGLSDVAEAGDTFVVAPNEKVASKVASTREHWMRLSNIGSNAAAGSGGAKLEDIFKQIQAGETATLNLIVKADVNGSLEAVADSLKKMERDEVKLAFVLRGVGGVTENDVQLAAASNATILGFNVRPDRKARELADQENVEIRNYEIIYKLLEDIEKAMLGMLEPEYEEVITGEAEVREIFRVPKVGAIAGCMVTNGTVTRGSKVRFLREGTIIWKGDLTSLRRFKDDVKEVSAGFECGLGLSDFQDLKGGDIIETYEEREIPRE